MRELTKGTLQCGFAYELNLEVVNDMRFLLLLSNSTSDGLAFPKAFEMLFGNEQLLKLCAYLEEHNIPPSVETFSNILTELIETVSELKNS